MTEQKITRRALLAHSALSLGAAAVFSPSRTASLFGAESSAFEIIQTKVISQTPDIYYGWPTAAITASDEILVVASGGRQKHICPFGRVDLFRSKDGGETWTWPQTLYDGPIDDRDAGVLVTATGTILVTTFTSLAYESRLLSEVARRETNAPQRNMSDAELDQWLAAHERISAEDRKNELGCWMIRSTDGGKTWSPRYSSILNSPHGPIQLSDGRLLYPGRDLWGGSGRVGVCQSTDDGRTWEFVTWIDPRDGDESAKYFELHGCRSDRRNPHRSNSESQCRRTF